MIQQSCLKPRQPNCLLIAVTCNSHHKTHLTTPRSPSPALDQQCCYFLSWPLVRRPAWLFQGRAGGGALPGGLGPQHWQTPAMLMGNWEIVTIPHRERHCPGLTSHLTHLQQQLELNVE